MSADGVICSLLHMQGRAKSASSYTGDSDVSVKLRGLHGVPRR